MSGRTGLWRHTIPWLTYGSTYSRSHLRTQHRVTRLEVKSQFVESKGELFDETHDAVIRLEGRMTMLETDLRNSSEAFAATMKATADSQERVEGAINKIGRLIKL